MCPRALIYRLLAASWLLFGCLGTALALVPPSEWGTGGFVLGLLHGLVQWCLVAGVAMLTLCMGRLLAQARRVLVPPPAPRRVLPGPRLPW